MGEGEKNTMEGAVLSNEVFVFLLAAEKMIWVLINDIFKRVFPIKESLIRKQKFRY